MNQASAGTLEIAGDLQPVPSARRELPALTPARDDQELVSAARHGDDRAFASLYERYRSRIHSFAVRMVHDPDRAEDLVQEVFISALRRLRETDTPIVFRPWIYEIARNACIDEYRRHRRVAEVPIERDGLDSWLDHLVGGPSPDAAMQSKQQLEDLCGAFHGLSERHHRIIVARELEGKSYRQIGKELDMSQAVVESTLFRARRRLTDEFEELTTGRRCERVLSIIGTGAQGRRLGIRERRAVTTHIEHCRSCRHQALAAGFNAQPRAGRALQKVAAAILPLPLFRALRRAGRGAQQRVAASASPLGHLGQTLASAGSGRMAVAAVTAVVAGVSGGLLSQAGAPRAEAVTRPAAPVSRTIRHSAPSRPRAARGLAGASHATRQRRRASGASGAPHRVSRPGASLTGAISSTSGRGGPAERSAATSAGHAAAPSAPSLSPPPAGSVTSTVRKVRAAVRPLIKKSSVGAVADELEQGSQPVGGGSAPSVSSAVDATGRVLRRDSPAGP